MRVLAVTKIFPNSAEPLSSPFNRQQFAELARMCDLKVLATIPWFPGVAALKQWTAAGRLTAVPAKERIAGIEVEHPRFLYVPKFAYGLTGPLYVASLLKDVLPRRGSVDVVLGSFAYPDGYAAIKLGQLLGVPAVVKLHGSDINVVAQLPGPERRLRAAFPKAERVVAVSAALAAKAVTLGAQAERVHVVPNGVDQRLFHPQDRQSARAELGLPADRRLIVYVGRLEEPKGVGDLLTAFEAIAAERRDLALALVGGGSLTARAAELAQRYPGQVVVAGPVALERVPTWLAASDVVTLPSWNEGMPNAVLEALASGRRVVGTRVGGIPDLLHDPELGELVDAKQPALLAPALARAADHAYDPARIQQQSGTSSWVESANQLLQVLELAVSSSQRKAA